MADGTLNFNTEMDTRSVQQGIELILQELRKISAAIQGVPEIRVEADTSQVEETRREIDSLPDQTDIEVDVTADRTEVEATRRDIDSLPDQTDIEVDVESDRTEIVETEDVIEDVGDTAEKTADEASKAFKKASNNAGSAVNGSCDDILKSLSSMLGKVKGLLAAAGLAIGLKEIVSLGKEAVESAAEVNAATSQLEQTFGAFQSTAEKSIKRVADQSGILDTRLRGTATSIYAFAKTSGMDATTALSMMEDSLQVAADSAAYYDRSLEETSETLKSFLKGNYANDAALGLSATEYTRNAAAMKLYGKSFQELSEAQKQLTLLQMVKDANKLSGAEGQAAREADGWENVIGNLKEAWKQLLAVVGQPILEVATIAVQKLTAALSFLTERARAAINAMNQLLGRETKQSDSMASSIEQSVVNQEALTDAVNDTAKAQKKSLASFDKLNTLSSGKDEGSKASSASVAQSMPVTVETSKAEDDIDKFAKKLKTVFTRLKNWWQKNFAPIFSGVWDGLKGEAQELWGTLQGVFSDIQSLGGPLLDYFNNYFTPFLQAAFEVAGKVIVGLFDTFNTVFSDIWDIVLYPYLQTYLTVGLPMLTEFATEAIKTFGVYFDEVKKIFDMLWADVARPALTFIMQLWQDLMLSFKAFWDKWGAPIFEKLRTAIQKASEIYQKAWNTIWKPVFDKFMSAVDELWSKHMKPLVDNVLDFVGVFIDAALDIYNGFVAPILGWFIDKFGPVISMVLGNVIEAVSKYAGSILDATSHIIDYLKGVVNFVAGVFTGDWSRAWEGIKTAFAGAWGALADIVKAPVNLIIGMINHLLDCIEYGINSTIWNLNNLSFDIPDWVPEIGGETFGFNLSMIDIPELPYLAKGTVVPANYGEFLAVLGDNKREAEVVSPLSTIKKAVAEAMAESGGAGPKEITLYTYLYPNSAAYHREIINIVNADARNRGGV